MWRPTHPPECLTGLLATRVPQRTSVTVVTSLPRLYTMRGGVQALWREAVDKCGGVHLTIYLAMILCLVYMDTSEAGRRGAEVTNKILTPEMRRKAAKKGWKKRQKMLREKALA